MSIVKNLLQLISPLRGDTKKSSRRNDPRIVLPLSRVGFLRSGSKNITVANLSRSGIAFLRSDFDRNIEEGDQIQGQLRIEKKTYDLDCIVVHISPQLIGCEFADSNRRLDIALKKAFEVELRAHDMIEVTKDVLKSPTEGTPFYYRGSPADELFLVSTLQGIPYFILIFDNNVVAGGYEHPIETGYIDPEINQKTTNPSLRYPIIQHANLDTALLGRALTFLENIPHISKDHHQELKSLIKEGR